MGLMAWFLSHDQRIIGMTFQSHHLAPWLGRRGHRVSVLGIAGKRVKSGQGTQTRARPRDPPGEKRRWKSHLLLRVMCLRVLGQRWKDKDRSMCSQLSPIENVSRKNQP